MLFVWRYLSIVIPLLATTARAQVTLPSSSGQTVNLDSTYPAEAVFVLPQGGSIISSGAAVTGGNSQTWQFTNYGTLQDSSSTAAGSALKLGSATFQAARVDNYGVLQSLSNQQNGPAGVQFTQGGTVYNHAGGLISGPDGVHTDGGSVAVFNDGQIIGTVSAGVYTGEGAIVDNSPTGVITGDYGVVSNGKFNVIVTNAGVISGETNALWFFGSGTYSVVNQASGIIEGGTASQPDFDFDSSAPSQMLNYGLFQNQAGTVVRSTADDNILINAGSILAGSNGGIAIDMSGNGNTVYNLGTLTGATTAVRFSGNDNTIVLGTNASFPTSGLVVSGPGSVLNGALLSTGTGNAVVLTDTGSEGVAVTGFDTLTMDGVDWTLGGAVSLSGTSANALLVEQGVLRLAGSMINTGGTQVDLGATLLVGGATHPGAVLASNGGVTVDGTVGGYGTVIADVLNHGVVTAADASPGLQGQGNGSLTLVGQMQNDGVIDLRGQLPGNQLHIVGDYVGQGALRLNTQLDGDGSPSDQLIVDGANDAATATGDTAIRITNVGGQGDLTVNGILVVGLAHGASSTSNAFTLAGRAVAGLYEYELVQNPANGQWYLSSSVSPPPTPPNPPAPPTPPSPPTPRYRPEIGAYLANVFASATLFNHEMHDRIGDNAADGSEPSSGSTPGSSVWVRMRGAGNDGSVAGGRVAMSSTSWLLHIGSDVGAWPLAGDADRFHLGVMAAYGHVNTSATATSNPNRATGSVDSYAAGLYGTWFQDDARRVGAYVDSWLLYGWQESSVSGESLPTQAYHSQIATASLESGYALGPFGGRSVVVTPLAQVIWNGYFDRTVFESATDTTVNFVNPDGLTTRLGFRVGGTVDTSATTRLVPFFEVAWRHAYGQTQLAMNGRTVSVDGSRNLAEIDVGLNGRVNTRWRIWSKLGAAFGGNGKGFNGAIGTRYEY